MRAYPFTRVLPKSLLEVDGVSLLVRNVTLLRDQIGVSRIVIVLGHFGECIREVLGNGSRFGVAIEYVENRNLERELPWSIALACQQIDGPACVVLADECYVGTNHRDLLAASDPQSLITCALIHAENPRAVRNNYTVEMEGDQILRLHEKPTEVADLTMGTGTYLVSPEAQTRLIEAFGDGSDGPGDWSGWIDGLACGGASVRTFLLDGHYVNVNSRNDLNYANHLVRACDFAERRTSVVYISDQQEESAGPAILAFAREPEVSQVIAVARRRTASLEEAAQHEKVRLLCVDDENASVGMLCRTGMDAADGDILITTLSDDTFSPSDVSKLLVFLRDADMVVGTRTTRQMIEQGSNMRGAVRFAHIFLAKLLELFWWRFDSRFTDICCVYRGVWRHTYELIRDQLTSDGVEIFPEMVIEVLRARKRIIEIPVNYYNRDLLYPYVRSRYQSAGTFLRILRLIVRKRCEEVRLSFKPNAEIEG